MKYKYLEHGLILFYLVNGEIHATCYYIDGPSDIMLCHIHIYTYIHITEMLS